MSEIKRYDLEEDYTKMCEFPDGDYVLYSDHKALIDTRDARIAELEECNDMLGKEWKDGLAEIFSLKAEVERLKDRLDLSLDEFQRIAALTDDSEIKGICERAKEDIRQTVPLIEQRDKAEADLTRMREQMEGIRKYIKDYPYVIKCIELDHPKLFNVLDAIKKAQEEKS